MKFHMSVIRVLMVLCLAVPGLAQKQSPPEGGAPKDFVLPEKATFTLDNGLAATLVSYGIVPKVSVRVVVRTGNINEAENQVWLADLAGDLMKEGTLTRTAQEVARDAAAMGGDVAINVGSDQTYIGGAVLSEFGPKLVALLADVLRNPRFPESELARLKNDRVRALSIDKSDPQSLALEKYLQVLYPGHPYGRMHPTEEMLKAYTLAQVRDFYEKNFGASRTHVYISGRFDEKKMEEAIRKAFGDWKRGEAPLINVPKPVSKRAIYLVDRPGASQSTVYIGLPVIDPSNPDYRALLVTNALLGGSFASRITSNIREDKGYTYSPGSTLSSRYRDAYWAEYASVSTDVTGPSLKEIFYEIDRLAATPPSADELKGIQNYLAGVFVLRNSTPEGIISQLSFLDLHGLPDSYLKEYVKAVYAATPEKVQELTKTYLRSKDMVIVIAGDRKKIQKQIELYGRIVN